MDSGRPHVDALTSGACDEKAVLKISSFTGQFLTTIWFMNKTTGLVQGHHEQIRFALHKE
jgi:hypothetical protein